MYRTLIAITLLVVSSLTIHSLAAPPNSPEDSERKVDAKAELKSGDAKNTAPLRREGETHEAVGRFAQTGDRYMFYPADDGPALRILENLSLERVARVLDASHRRVEPTWNVSGIIYEFRGSNYFLIERAIVKGRTHLSER